MYKQIFTLINFVYFVFNLYCCDKMKEKKNLLEINENSSAKNLTYSVSLNFVFLVMDSITNNYF